MDFKLAMEHVRNGTATEEERRLVDSEVDKYLLITEHLDAQWEKEAPPTPEAIPEMKQLHAKLRRRNILLILTCLLLVAAIAAAVAAYIAPRMEEKQQQQVQQQVQQEVAPQVQQQLEDKEKALEEENAKYWHPDDHTYLETDSDLNLALECYAELRLIDYYSLDFVNAVQTDVGTYQLSLHANKWTSNDTDYLLGILEKDVLTLPKELDIRYSYFLSALNNSPIDFHETEHGKEELENCRSYYQEYLSILPDYIKVSADIAFPKSLNMEQLLEFNAMLEDMGSRKASFISWVGIRTDQLGVCGMTPFSRGSYGEDPSEEYPLLRSWEMRDSAENLEQHFKSLLAFTQDQIDQGRDISAKNEPSWYYGAALDYVEENGVYAYGCRIVTEPRVLLELMERGIITYVTVWDYWISG